MKKIRLGVNIDHVATVRNARGENYPSPLRASLLAEKCGADWDVAIKGFLMDSRIGQSHYQVPGPDGKLGFGGHCLPKDINALKSFGESLGLNLNTLNGVINTNLEVRPEKDWESDSRAFTSNQIEIPFEN